MSNKNLKQKILLLSIMIMMVFGAGATIAYISTHTDDINNTFTPSSVSCDVDENFNGKVKSAVKIKNTGDIAAYIRAEVVVTWKKESTNAAGEKVVETYGMQPVKVENLNTEDGDYIIKLDSPTQSLEAKGWIEKDGFYYYTEKVPAGEFTSILVEECKLSSKAVIPEGYHLSVEIIASAIQADGGSKVGNTFVPAATQAWGVNVVDGELSAE